VIGRIGNARLIMLTTTAMAGGTAVPAADWSETLEAAANAAYVTNPQLQPGSNVADKSALLGVDGSVSAQTERGQLSLTPRFSIIRYQQLTGLNTETGSIDITYLEKLERGQWTFTAQALTDSTVTSELGLTGITNVNRRHDAGTASLGYQYLSSERLSWQLQGAWQVTRYSDAARFGLTDYDYGSVQFGPTWSFSERLQGSLNIEADRINPKGGATENDYSVSMQLKRSLSERYAWRASIGATRVDSGSTGSATSSVFELGATRQGERAQWDVSVKRAVLPVGLGLLAREDQATATIVVGTSERSTLNLSVSAIRSDPVSLSIYLNPYISLRYLVYSGASWGQASAEWKYNFSPHWSISTAYVQARARSGNLQEWANGNQARLAMLWQSGRL
jgi:hypothetical protein